MKREMSVAGSFYPAQSSEIERYFKHFTQVYDANFKLPQLQTKAIIVPHAGYIYSGFSANVAYRVLAQSHVKTFVIIGPSHKVAFYGASMCEYQGYETPLGELPSSQELFLKLKESFTFESLQSAHHEHSTEVQFPFIKYYFPDAKIIEIVYGVIESKEISAIINFLLELQDVGIIISTDLSHFYALEEAKKLDSLCIDAIEYLDINKLHDGCQACGKIGVEAMMLSAKLKGYHAKVLDYRTSADASQDSSRVVGYMSACFV